MVTRRQAREWALQLLVQFDLNPPVDVASSIDAFWEQQTTLEAEALAEEARGVRVAFTASDPADLASLAEARAFAEARVNGVWSIRDGLDEQLQPHLKNWAIYRLGTVERNVLRLGLWELTACEGKIPAPIVVNECVDLAKFFSETKSGRFVNAVLDAIARAKVSGEAGEFRP